MEDRVGVETSSERKYPGEAAGRPAVIHRNGENGTSLEVSLRGLHPTAKLAGPRWVHGIVVGNFK